MKKRLHKPQVTVDFFIADLHNDFMSASFKSSNHGVWKDIAQRVHAIYSSYVDLQFTYSRTPSSTTALPNGHFSVEYNKSTDALDYDTINHLLDGLSDVPKEANLSTVLTEEIAKGNTEAQAKKTIVLRFCEHVNTKGLSYPSGHKSWIFSTTPTIDSRLEAYSHKLLVEAYATTISHELGHLFGLEHNDAYNNFMNAQGVVIDPPKFKFSQSITAEQGRQIQQYLKTQ
ncbi:MAG: hypothetical protein WC254_00055 [Candidatus Woesearchaeota archaeon]|jgi:hypothetical protein